MHLESFKTLQIYNPFNHTPYQQKYQEGFKALQIYNPFNQADDDVFVTVCFKTL